MKRVIIICSVLLIALEILAQAPEKFSYQAIIRDGSNNLVVTSTIGMQMSILQGSITGTEVYKETQAPTTNENGLISTEVGTGTIVSGSFSSIERANGGPFFIRTEIDPTGGSNYTITGVSELLSVPFSLHAKTSHAAEVLLDNYISIWDDNSTVNIQPNKKYFINADNVTLVLPPNTIYFEKDNIDIYIMQHVDNPRNITMDWTNSLPIGAVDENNDFIGFGINPTTTATGHFQLGNNKINNIGDFWMCGGFTPN